LRGSKTRRAPPPGPLERVERRARTLTSGGLVYGVCVEEWFSSALYVEGSTPHSKEVHGHDYRVRLCLESSRLRDGFVLDHYLARALLRSCIEPLDHRLLNTVIEPPTTENLALSIAGCVGKALEAEGIEARVSLVEVCTGNGLCGYVRPAGPGKESQ